ncbi:MAG: hypothetical protein R3F14_28270 [Polyangiaceae bacterium]
MSLSDASRVAATTLPFRDGTGRVRVAVIVKATFALRSDRVADLAEPLPISGDVPLADGPASSLAVASISCP